MATIKDLEAIKKAMEDCREHPLQCRWVEDISISYIEFISRYIAVFDSDLTIVFDSVGYSSNTLYFYRNGDEYPVAHITHKGLHKKVSE